MPAQRLPSQIARKDQQRRQFEWIARSGKIFPFGPGIASAIVPQTANTSAAASAGGAMKLRSKKVIEEWPALVFSTEAASGAKTGHTLLPMLIAGLSLIVLGGTVLLIVV